MNNDDLLSGQALTTMGLKTKQSILDSKHISATNRYLYDIKLVECGNYTQIYFYKNRKSKTLNNVDIDLQLKKIKIDNMVSTDNEVISKKKELSNVIEQRSIIRSKLMCQRLAKSNLNDWQTFITLTFSENITDIDIAYKRFKYFVDKVRRIKKDFKYICITEFQKRGAIHYHLLCNVDINDSRLIYSQVDNPKFKHIKYWLDGFDSVEVIKGDAKKIIGYIAKYMTKDIDNRLFSKHRYFYSKNVRVPKSYFINLDDIRQKDLYLKKIQDRELIYHNEYCNPYDNTSVSFLEFSK